MHCFTAFLLALLTNLIHVDAGGFGFGGCPNQSVVNAFVSGPFMGTWYEWGKYLHLGQIITGCTKIVYTPGSPAPLINIEVETITFGGKGSAKGKIKRADPSKTEAKFTISYWENAFEGQEAQNTDVNYQILSTDYTNYAIIYNCFNFFLFHVAEVFIYTRLREPPQALIDEVYDELNDRGIGTLFMTQTRQRDCDN